MDDNDWLNTSVSTPVCPMCGQEVSPRAGECPSCGEVLVPQVGPDPEAPVFEAERKRRSYATILVGVLFAGLGGFLVYVFARLLFGPNRVGSDTAFDASVCIGAFVGGVGGWSCCEKFGWERNPAVQWLTAGLFVALLLGTCVASSIFK